MSAHVEALNSGPNGRVPNSRFPLLIHRDGIPGGGVEPVRKRFQRNGWLNNWQYPGIYVYHHFHSTSHECLGVANGWMELELFGKGGTKVRVATGDVIVMPAGVSHAMIGNSEDVMVIGGYPEGRDWDNIQEDHLSAENFRAAVKLIMSLPIPATDPVTGDPLSSWRDAPSSVDAGWNDFRDALDATSS